MGAMQEVVRNRIRDLASLGVVMRMCYFLKEFAAQPHELGVGVRVEESKERKRAAKIVDRRRPSERARSFERDRNTTSNDIGGVLAFVQNEFRFEAACEFDRETLVWALGAQQRTVRLSVGEHVTRSICGPRAIPAGWRNVVIGTPWFDGHVLWLTHVASLMGV